MGEYTTTFDASHKVKTGGGGVRGWIRHVARDVERVNGVEVKHANRRIVPERTPMNTTLVRDASGDLVPCTDSRQIDEALARRLATVKKPLRRTAVVMRPLVMMLDPNWMEEHNSDWRENGLNDEALKYHAVMREWAEETFGRENIICESTHMDETSVGLQLGFTPVTDDGRLSQKDWFTGPTRLKNMHVDLRKKLIEAGYEATLEVTERSQEHLGSEEYAARAQKVLRDEKALKKSRDAFNHEYVAGMAELDEGRQELDAGRQELDEERSRLQQIEDELDEEVKKLPARRAALRQEVRAEVRAELVPEVRAQVEAELESQRTATAAALARVRQREEEIEKEAALRQAYAEDLIRQANLAFDSVDELISDTDKRKAARAALDVAARHARSHGRSGPHGPSYGPRTP